LYHEYFEFCMCFFWCGLFENTTWWTKRYLRRTRFIIKLFFFLRFILQNIITNKGEFLLYNLSIFDKFYFYNLFHNNNPIFWILIDVIFSNCSVVIIGCDNFFRVQPLDSLSLSSNVISCSNIQQSKVYYYCFFFISFNFSVSRFFIYIMD
jgi:hypothetical protein